MVLVETERLFIRDWVPDDWKRYKPLATDPRVLKYICVEPSPDERIKAFVNGGIRVAETRGWILWPVIHRGDAELIGFCGFNDGFPPDVELGWRLRPDYWGRGLATEIAQAVMEYGWNEFAFERLVSVIHPDNRASIRVAEKLGMILDGTLSYHGLEVLRYVRNNPWLEQKAQGVSFREVPKADLAILFEQQREPEAVEMAAFPPREHEDFMAHWARILADPNVIARTVLLDGAVAGNMVCWQHGGKRLIGYWLGRRYWGKGVATQALSAFVGAILQRPLYAHVPRHNVASIRVLEKCGFRLTGQNRSAAPTGGAEVDEFVYVLQD